ncbi:hypothetical protein GGI35DRAFT_33567 [Trichoderma velutinum]
MDGPEHLRLSPQCGICADGIQTDEMAVALYRSSRNPASYHCSPSLSFPSRDLRTTFVVSHNAIETASCNADECGACAASPEAAAAHHGCYEVFMHKCLVDDRQALLRRLLVLASWRRPWKEAQPLFLPSRVDRHTLDAVAGMFGLPQLCGLPVELLEMIRGYSAHSLFWRSISALRVAAHVSDTRDELQRSEVVALRHVVSWERGGELDKSDSQTLPPIIRLTIDSDGISKIERLSSHPRYSRGNYTHTAYIVGSENDQGLSDGVEIELVDGHLRLKLPPDGKVPHIWNTPNPPPLSQCNISRYETPATWSRLFAVKPDSIRGITFFYNQGRLCDIHFHYPEGPSAHSTYNQMKRVVQRNATWLYLPVPQGDRLTVVGERQQRNSPSCRLPSSHLFSCHLFRLEKSGDVIIGARGNSRFDDRCLGTGTAITLVYGEPNRADRVPRVERFGAKSSTESRSLEESSLPGDFPLDKYEPSPLTASAFLQAEYFSWAPLDGVASALVFYDQTTGCCKGILLHYLNGGSRALGECRLHVDPAQRVARPSLLCIQTESRPIPWRNRNLAVYRTRATFQHSSQHDCRHEHERLVSDGFSVDDEWKCYLMVGYARFWFTAEASYISVTTEPHMETAAKN